MRALTSYSADLNAAKNLAHPMLDVRQAAVTQPHSRSHEAKGTPSGATAAALLSWLDTPERLVREAVEMTPVAAYQPSSSSRALKSPFGVRPTEGV